METTTGKIKIAADSFKYHLFLKNTIKINIKQKKKLVVPVSSSGYTTMFAQQNNRHIITKETNGCVHLGVRKLFVTKNNVYPKKKLINVVTTISILPKENKENILNTSQKEDLLMEHEFGKCNGERRFA